MQFVLFLLDIGCQAKDDENVYVNLTLSNI